MELPALLFFGLLLLNVTRWLIKRSQVCETLL
jgi:hypothetical protein